MRYSEIRTLRWNQIDLPDRTIRVGKARTEGGSGRAIPMNGGLAAVFEMHRDWYASEKGIGAVQPEWYIFPFSSRVKPVDPTRGQRLQSRGRGKRFG
jgi:integrase